MTIGILNEVSTDGRVCLLPNEIKTLIEKHKVTVLFEPGLGDRIGIHNREFSDSGAINAKAPIIFQNADMILSIGHRFNGQNTKYTSSFVGIFNPLFFSERLDPYKAINSNVFSLDMLPRSTIAQRMDVLSSMASLAGYRAVLKAVQMFQGNVPMFTTAAGTLKPAKVLVLGAGVAGLQAIATAKRLGAQVEAFDVRSSAGDEVRSLGAKFIEIPGYKESSAAGGYALEQDERFLMAQQDAIAEHLKDINIVICTANIPGKKAPVLINKPALEGMIHGSIIVDLAAEQGGNCALTENNKTIELASNGVKIVGDTHIIKEAPEAASKLLSTNYMHFLDHYLKHVDAGSELLSACQIIRSGEIIHPKLTVEPSFAQ